MISDGEVPSGADLNQPDNDGTTAAHTSAQNGHTECLQLLADHKADLNQPANNGYTPAHMSAGFGHTEPHGVSVATGRLQGSSEAT